MKSYIKSIIFLSCILVGGNYVCGMEDNQILEPRIKKGITVIATFKIGENDANKDVRIINDRDGFSTDTRTDIDSIEIYKLGKGGTIGHQVECIKGNGESGDKNYEFNEPGVYRIYYYFQEGVIDTSYMFSVCSKLTSLDLSNFNTQNVTDMRFMFYKCSSLTSLNLNNFNTEMVTDMSCMFFGCTSLPSLNVSNFDTKKVTDMSYMFSGCSSLATLNLSSFKTNSVTNMPGMFSGCTFLETLDLSNFNTDSAKDKNSLFDKCMELNEVTTNDKHIKDWCEKKNIAVLPPKKEDENIEIGDNSGNLKGDTQPKSESKCCCCPCC